MLGETGLQTSFDIAVRCETANGISRNFRDRRNCLIRSRRFIRQSNIADEQVELVAHGGFHCRTNIMSCRHEMPAMDQQFFQSSARVLVIVNEQNLQALIRSFAGCFCGTVPTSVGDSVCIDKMKCRSAIASSLCAVSVPPWACTRDFEMARPKPSRQTMLKRAVPCSNGSKMPLHDFWLHADTSVAHTDGQKLRRLIARGDNDLAVHGV